MAVLLALVGAGCGGSDEGDDAGGEESAGFVEQADAICLDASESFIELTRDPVTSPEEGAELDAEVIELREDTNARLGELEPPADVRSAYEAFLDADGELTALNTEIADAFAANDEGRIRRLLPRLEELEQEVDAAAADAGLVTCAGRLPDEEAVEAASTAREFLTSTDPAICTELATEKLIGEVYGGEVERCEREIESRDPPSEVTTSNVSGTELSATLDARLSGGETLDVFLIQDDGGWRVDIVNQGA